MTSFPPPHPAAHNSIASSTNKSSGAQPVRGQQSAWGLPAPGTSARRGLTPLSTNLGSSSLESSGRPHLASSSSPFTSSFSSVLNSSATNEHNRTSYTSSLAASAIPSLQSGSQQASSGQSLLSPRSRAITPSSTPYSASSAAASTTASQAGGGGSSGGGGSFRHQTLSPPLPQHSLSSPTTNAFDRSATGLNSSSLPFGQSSVSKIVVTQVFLLLGSITEKEGKAKWDAQAEVIHKVWLSQTQLKEFDLYSSNSDPFGFSSSSRTAWKSSPNIFAAS